MNKQSLITILLTVLMSVTGAKAFAHDIEANNSDGVTIYYKWANKKTELAVTYYSVYNSASYAGNVNIPKSVVYEGNPYPVTSIGDNAFYNCKGITSVTIPDGVTSIGKYAFANCSSMNSVNIPNSITSIGGNAFLECNGLTSVQISDINTWCNIYFPDIYSNPLFYAHHLYLNGEEMTELIIPSSVTSIGDYAFYGGCNSLTSISIPQSVTAIGTHTFRRCSSSLTSIKVESGNPKYDSRNNCNALIETSTNTLVLGCKNTNIPNSVQSIGNYAFEGYSGLTSITIPSSVTSIGGSAFWDCSGLASITIPNTVTSIGNNAFYGCSNLKSLAIPEHITKRNIHVAKAGTFSKLLPQDESYIVEELTITGELNGDDFYLIRIMSGEYWYYNNDPMNTGGKLSVLNMANASIVCGGEPYIVSHISPGDYYNEYSLTKNNTIPTYLFHGCDKLTTIVLPENLISIENSAFTGCGNLTSITIPSSVTAIGSYAFEGCNGLTDFCCKAGIVPETGSDVFRNINQESITLYVPKGSIDAYSAVEPWKNFKIVELGLQCATPEISIVNGKIKLSSNTEGATYHYTITNEDVKSGNGDEVQLGMTYHVSAYATKAGFETSEVATRDIVITGNSEAVVKGDVDGNGKVDAADIVTVTNIIMEKK